MNQKELIRELKEMHLETLNELRELKIALLALVEKGVAVHAGSANIRPRSGYHSVTEGAHSAIEIDNSTFVTKISTENMEKGYDELAETKSEEDSKLKSNLEKLRKLKKGE